MAPTTVDIDNICPWELHLRLNGVLHHTRRPTWGDVIALSQTERLINSGDMTDQQREGLEGTLRDAVQRFMPADAKADVDKLAWDDLLAAFSACSAYFSVYLAKKKLMPAEAVSPPAPAQTQAQTKTAPAPAVPRGRASSPSPA